MDAGIIKVSVDPHRSIHSMPYLARDFARIIDRAQGASVLHNQTDVDLISSDNPVIYFNRSPSITPYPVAPDDTFEYLFVLTPRMAVYFASNERPRNPHRSLRSSATALKINELVARFSDRFLIASSERVLAPLIGFYTNAPVPIADKSIVIKSGQCLLHYEFGPPLQLPKWTGGFEPEETESV